MAAKRRRGGSVASSEQHERAVVVATPREPVTLTVFDSIQEDSADMLECACRLFERGVAALERGQVAEAESLLLDALEIFERENGEDSPDVANILSVLSEVYRDEQHLDDAEWCAERSLAIIERVDVHPGRPDPDVGMLRLQALEGLAGIYRIEGQTEKMKPLERRARRLEQRMWRMRGSCGGHPTRLAISHWPTHCRW